VRAPVTLAFAPETGRLSGSLFVAAWGLRVGHLSRIAPDGYGKLSADSETTTFEGTDAIAQSGGMAFGVDDALYVTSREKGAIYRFRFGAGGKPSAPERMFSVTGTPGAMAEGTDGHLYFLMNHGLTGSLWRMAFDETLTPTKPVRIGTLPGTAVALARDPVEGNLFALLTSQTKDSVVVELTRDWIDSASENPEAPTEAPTIRFSLAEWLTRLEEGDVDPREIPFPQAELPRHLAYLRVDELDSLSFDALGSLYLGSRDGNLMLKFELPRPSGRYAVGVAAGVVERGLDLSSIVRMHAWKKTVLGL
jgi:hypothetical protein